VRPALAVSGRFSKWRGSVSISSIIRLLKPREAMFFDLLEKAAANLLEAIKFFRSELETNDPARWSELRHQMKIYEHIGDDINKEVIDHLDQTFVTPIERDDILQLSEAIDNVIDRLDAVSEKFVLYRVGQIRPAALVITNLLIDGASELVFLMKSIKKMSNVKEMRNRIRLIQSMEDQIDAIYNTSLAELFATAANAIELIKWKEIIWDLEDAADSIALVAKVVGSTITKNA
jgi:predicted phosphate transport protein (TIGR00153 family)